MCCCLRFGHTVLTPNCIAVQTDLDELTLPCKHPKFTDCVTSASYNSCKVNFINTRKDILRQNAGLLDTRRKG